MPLKYLGMLFEIFKCIRGNRHRIQIKLTKIKGWLRIRGRNEPDPRPYYLPLVFYILTKIILKEKLQYHFMNCQYICLRLLIK